MIKSKSILRAAFALSLSLILILIFPTTTFARGADEWPAGVGNQQISDKK